MGIRELRKLYGKTNSRDAVNAAIRAELVGGDDLLDALPLVHRLAKRTRERGLAGEDLAQRALTSLTEMRDVMADIVLQKER